MQGHVEYRDVEFTYPARPDVMVLKKVCFEMQQGQMTALVGASGSGKSTVAALLFRRYDPCAGEVRTSLSVRYLNITETLFKEF